MSAPLPETRGRPKGRRDRIKSRLALRDEAKHEALRDWQHNRDWDRRDLEALRDAIEAGIGDGTGMPADEVFTELRARYADQS